MTSRPENNEDFESQFKGSPLAEKLGERYQNRKEFYLEYVTSDYDHEVVCRISKSMAISLIESSPYLQFMSDWEVCRSLAADEVTGVTNKGAIRITPSEPMYERMLAADANVKADWGDLMPWRLDEEQVWVYNHDGRYSITRPLKTK